MLIASKTKSGETSTEKIRMVSAVFLETFELAQIQSILHF